MLISRRRTRRGGQEARSAEAGGSQAGHDASVAPSPEPAFGRATSGRRRDRVRAPRRELHGRVDSPRAGRGSVQPASSTRSPARTASPGTRLRSWYVYNDGSPTIQGYATRMSVNLGETISFKINTNAHSYGIEIYRFGYYGGNGARRVATFAPSASLPQSQPSCLSNATTGLVDCGNWAVSASWNVPDLRGLRRLRGAAHPQRHRRHVVDPVRRARRREQLEGARTRRRTRPGRPTTTTAGTASTSGPARPSRAPPTRSATTVRSSAGATPTSTTTFFTAEMPMVRFLERNGYDVSYFSDVDTDVRGVADPATTTCSSRRVTTSTGPRSMRNNVDRGPRRRRRTSRSSPATRCSGRRATSRASTAPAPRPHPRHVQGDPPGHPGLAGRPDRRVDGYVARPALTPRRPTAGGPRTRSSGTLLGGQRQPQRRDQGPCRVQEPPAVAEHRDRDASPAGGTYTMPTGTLGYEWDADKDNGFRPPGLIDLSSTSVTMSQTDINNDNGGIFTEYGHSVAPGTAVHNMTLYRAPSGALVFSSGDRPVVLGARLVPRRDRRPRSTSTCNRRRSTSSPTWVPSRRP